MTSLHSSDPCLSAAANALAAEALAVGALAERLRDDVSTRDVFGRCVDFLLALRGRVVVTGVGKSGHIGGKIAATFASTGAPSFFVHPTEALHGDLGMITPNDAVLALSHSGESKELGAIINYCGRFNIPLIALTGRADSTLGRAAAFILDNGVREEACPLGLAPTTSTTATLALADALAVALMTARGFSPQDFAVFHPGGKLGAQLLRVGEVMLRDGLPLLSDHAPLRDVLEKLTQANKGCVGFTDADGRLNGIFTDGDLKRALLNGRGGSAEWLDTAAARFMTPGPACIDAASLAVRGVQVMQERRVKALWVVDAAGKPEGLFRLDECLARGVV